MLEGKEVEGKIGEVGSYFLDVDEMGKISIGVEIGKDLGDAKVLSSNRIEISIFSIFEKMAAKSGTPYDDMAIAALEKMLGIKKA